MKNIFKKNQLIISALAIMIAVAGYLNYSEHNLGGDQVAALAEGTTENTDLVSDISAEDMYAQTGLEEGDIASLDQDAEDLMADVPQEGENPGEAVMTASGSVGVGITADAKIEREQLRSKNKETLLEIINNTNIAEEQKQIAIDEMIEMTEIAERELATEVLLEAKGFEDVIVSITGETADIVVNMSGVDDAGRAQIEDIVTRKAEVSGENIVITPIADYE